MRIIKPKQEPEIKRVNVNVPVPLHNAFKSAVAAQGQDMSSVLTQLIRDYVDQYGVQPKGRRK